MRPSSALAVVIGSLALSACGGGAGAGPGPVVPPATYLYVKAVTGNDANAGTAVLPLKTLTKACTLALAGQTIVVLPGTYDAANGEVFPILVPPGVIVEGDVPNRGDGPVATAVVGSAPIGPIFATLSLSPGTVVRGLSVDASQTLAHFGIYVLNATTEINECTLPNSTYGGVYLDGTGASDVHHNTFECYAYGAWLQAPSGAVKVRNSTFANGSIGIRADAGVQAQILDNLFTTNVSAGLQAFGFSGLVQGNTFSSQTYSFAAVHQLIGTPVLRNNTFTSNLGVRIVSGNPDLGTAGQAGGNSFAGVASWGVRHEGSSAVEARGNTWQHAPPTKGTDIVVTGTGTVRYGPGAADIVP